MRVRASSNGLDARRRLASAFASGRWQARYSRDAIFAYLPKTSPNASAGIGRPQGAGWRSWTDGLIQNCDRLPIWIEPDCLVRGIIDHKPGSFSERGDPFRKAIEHLLHETHRPLSSVKIDAEEFLDADHRSHKNRARHGSLCENDGMRTKILPPDFVTGFGFPPIRVLEPFAQVQASLFQLTSPRLAAARPKGVSFLRGRRRTRRRSGECLLQCFCSQVALQICRARV
jgi:hypothetical protein